MEEEDFNEHIPTVEVQVKDDRWKYPVFSGFMNVPGGFFSGGKRFFILTRDGRLWMFSGPKSKKPKNKDPIHIRDMKIWSVDKPKLHCIKIERYPKPFFFYGKEGNTRLQWLEKLREVGGIKVGRSVPLNLSKNVPQISKKDLSEWNHKNVLEWLSFHSFRKDVGFLIYKENFKGVNGKQLENLRDIDLKSKLGISKLAHRKKIFREIRDVKKRRVFNFYEHEVLRKMENMTKGVGFKSKGTNWKFLARSLSDPECMQETYLNPSILKENIDRHLGKTVSSVRKKKKKNDDEKEKEKEESENEEEGEEEEEEVVVDDDDDEEDEIVKDIEKVNVDLRKEKAERLKLPVKLVVTEIVHSDGYKNTRRLLSPFISRIPNLSHEFGIFHTALIVGPWYLEWIDKSLVIPRKLYSGMALISADIDTSKLLTNQTIDQITEKLARVICRWNTTKTYCNMSMTSKPNYGNCQDFVEEVMEELQISLDRKGAFGKFLEKMKKKGKCEMDFEPSKEFKQKFGLDLDNYRFDTHQELDEFVRQLMKKDELSFQIEGKEEVKLLKSFDRAFWLRHFKQPGNEIYNPMNCPFDDPRKTKSYMVYS